jgi:hypothetical protein
MDREPRNTHFHIHWTRKNIFDWEPFTTHTEAVERAQELAGPHELFSVEELSVQCPACGARAVLAS